MSRWQRISVVDEWNARRGVPLDAFPEAAGVYVVFCRELPNSRPRLLYVGSSANLRTRWGYYLMTKGLSESVCSIYFGVAKFRERFADLVVKFRLARRRGEHLMAENRLIWRLNPPWNTVGRTPPKSLVATVVRAYRPSMEWVACSSSPWRKLPRFTEFSTWAASTIEPCARNVPIFSLFASYCNHAHASGGTKMTMATFRRYLALWYMDASSGRMLYMSRPEVYFSEHALFLDFRSGVSKYPSPWSPAEKGG